MEPHNTQPSTSQQQEQHPILSSNFATTFPAQFAAGLNAAAAAATNGTSNNVSSPLFMSTLQQLSGLSASAAAAGFLPNTNPQFGQIGNQFSTSNWNSQWLDQAKMAAMLPMYLQNAVTGRGNPVDQSAASTVQQFASNNNAAATMAEQNFKNTATVMMSNAYDSFDDKSGSGIIGSEASLMVGSPVASSNIYPSSTTQPKSQPQSSHSRKSYQQPPALSAAQSPIIYGDGNNVYSGNASSSNVPMTTFCPTKFSSNNLVLQQQIEQRKSPQIKQQLPVYSNKMNKSIYYQQPNHSESPAIYHQQPPPSTTNPVSSCRAAEPMDSRIDTPAQSITTSCTRALKPRQAGAVYGGRPPAQSQTENQYPQINVQQHNHQHQQSMNHHNSGQSTSFYSADVIMSTINNANVNRSRLPYVDGGSDRAAHHSSNQVHSSTPDSYATTSPATNRARPAYVDHNQTRDIHHQDLSASVNQLVSQQMPPPSLHPHILNAGEDHIGGTSVDDLSVLELHDFGEFLIDKDAVSAALGVDTAALFGESSVESIDSDEEGNNLNNVSSNNSSGPVGGASDRLVHDLSPSTSTTTTTVVNEQRKASSFSSNSTSSGNSAPLITSARMRELIHERRFEELANADKEVDRLVSLVARKDGRFGAASLSGGGDGVVGSTATPKSGGLSNNFSLFNFDLLASLKNQHMPTFNENPITDAPLNVVQFTPPDSPTEQERLAPILTRISNGPSTSQQSKTIAPLINTSKVESKSPNNCMERSSSAKTSVSGQTLKVESQPLIFIPKADDNPAGTSASLRMTSRASTSSATCYRPSSGVRQSMLAKSNRIPIYKQRSGATAGGFSAPRRFLPPPNDLSSKSRSEESGTAKSRPVFGRSSIFGFGQTKDAVSTRRSSADVDAYSFTDDEEDNEEEPAMPKAASAVKNQKAQKDQKATANNTVYIPGIGYTTPEGHTNTAEILRHVVPKKRLSAVSALERPPPATVKGDAVSTPFTFVGQQPDAKHEQPTLVEMIHRRRANAMRFLRTEPLSNGDEVDDVFVPSYTERNRSLEFAQSPSSVTMRHGGGVTCMIKMENPIPEADFTSADKEEIVEKPRSLPKLVIKFLKAEPENVETPQPLTNESENDRQKKKKKKHKKRDRDVDWTESNVEPCSDADEHGSTGSGHRKHKKHKKHHKKHHRHRSTSHHRDSLASITDTPSDVNSSASTFGGSIKTETQQTTEDDEGSFTTTGSKRRRMTAESAWSSGNHSDEVGGSSGDDHQELMGRQAAELEFVNLRLASFCRADPSLPKGTFMVLKEEVFKAECPLWKIDNQNLLQKYPPIQRPDGGVDGGGTSPIWYRNSSTYSGWCEKMAADYLVVNIRFVKQSRAENIIEPLVPVADLFPAVAVDLPPNDGDYALGMIDEEDTGADVGSDGSLLNDGSTGSRLFGSASNSKVGLREHLKTLIQAMLHHAITFNFIATVKSSNDWNYLCAFNEIDHQNNEALLKLRSRVKWSNGCTFEKALKTYSNYYSEQLKSNAMDQCQACGSGEPTMFVQFFTSEECTDSELLAEPVAKNRENLEDNSSYNGDLRDASTEEAVDFSICNSCERLAALYHKVHFMKYHIFKECESKLENIAPTVQSESLKPEAIVGQCIGKKSWLMNIINDYTEVWRKC